jgi:hypothetical protein
MAKPDIRFRTYLKAFFTDMLTGMSGPLSVPFAVAALWVPSRTQKIIWGCLAVTCALFASYRVWSKERRDGSAKISEMESELASLQQKPKLEVTVSVERDPPSQVVKVVASRGVTVSRVEYMLASGASIAGEDVGKQGQAVEFPVSDSLLGKVWNIPRADRNISDHSGPAKLGVTVFIDGQGHRCVVPVQMESFWKNSTVYKKVIGSETFYLNV